MHGLLSCFSHCKAMENTPAINSFPEALSPLIIYAWEIFFIAMTLCKYSFNCSCPIISSNPAIPLPSFSYVKISRSNPLISPILFKIVILSLSSFTSSCANSSSVSSTRRIIPYTRCLPLRSRKFSLEKL